MQIECADCGPVGAFKDQRLRASNSQAPGQREAEHRALLEAAALGCRPVQAIAGKNQAARNSAVAAVKVMEGYKTRAVRGKCEQSAAGEVASVKGRSK